MPRVLSIFVLRMNVKVNSPNSDSNLRLLTDITDVYGLQKHINLVPRERSWKLINELPRVANSSSTMIDSIYTNCSSRVVCSSVSHIGISDHSLIYVYLSMLLTYLIVIIKLLLHRKFKNFKNLKSFVS